MIPRMCCGFLCAYVLEAIEKNSTLTQYVSVY